MAAAALAGGLLLLSLDAHNTINPPASTPAIAYLPPLAAVCGAVLLRRRAPRAGLAVGTVAAAIDLALGGSLGTMVVYTQVLYDACVYGPPRLWRWLLRLSVPATVAGALVGVVLAQAWRGLWLGVLIALVALLPVLTGVSVRQYRDQAAAERARAQAEGARAEAERARAEAQRARAEAERARAEQTARLADLDLRQAVTAERTRMARELHDVVANHLSAVAIHATAALSLRDLDGDGVRKALTVIRASSVHGLADMRRMIELLRDAQDRRADDGRDADGRDRRDADGRADNGRADNGRDAGAAPDAPARAGLETDRLDGADRLIERARAAGLSVLVDTAGSPRELPAGVDLAAYRILQESLTNALKHGQGRATVTITYAPRHLALTVDSPLPGSGSAGNGGGARPTSGRAVPVPGAGAGLGGMRERADLLAGHLAAGPVDGQRLWRVHAELPTDGGTP